MQACYIIIYNLKLKQPLCKSDFERSFLFNHTPKLWNSLPPLNINPHFSVIKSKLRQYFWDHSISSFISDNVCTYHNQCPCSKCLKLPVKMHFGVSPLQCCCCIKCSVYYLFCQAAGLMLPVPQHSIIVYILSVSTCAGKRNLSDNTIYTLTCMQPISRWCSFYIITRIASFE